MLVQGQVDSKPCSLTVDTGAKCTFVHTGVMVAPDPPPAMQQLCGVKGHCMQLKGSVQARIEVGRAVDKMHDFVANSDESLLGLDYLQQSKVVLDFCKRAVVTCG